MPIMCWGRWAAAERPPKRPGVGQGKSRGVTKPRLKKRRKR